MSQQQQQYYQKQVKNYFLTCILGMNNMSTTYLAHHQQNHQPIYISAFQRQQFNSYKVLQEHFMKEVSFLQVCKSDNVIQLLDQAYSENNYYLLISHCLDWMISQHLRQQQILTELEATNYLMQIIRGYETYYSSNMPARDITIYNILKDGPTIKVYDFGFSKLIDYSMSGKTQEELDQQYKISEAPEAAALFSQLSTGKLSLQNIHEKCDVWSLGIIYFQMLYGQLPWSILQHQTGRDVLDKVMHNTLSIPLYFNKISNECQDLLTSMLRARPEERIGWSQLLAHPLFQKIEDSRKKIEQKMAVKPESWRNQIKIMFGQGRQGNTTLQLLKQSKWKESIQRQPVLFDYVQTKEKFFQNSNLQQQILTSNKSQQVQLLQQQKMPLQQQQPSQQHQQPQLQQQQPLLQQQPPQQQQQQLTQQMQQSQQLQSLARIHPPESKNHNLQSQQPGATNANISNSSQLREQQIQENLHKSYLTYIKMQNNQMHEGANIQPQLLHDQNKIEQLQLNNPPPSMPVIQQVQKLQPQQQQLQQPQVNKTFDVTFGQQEIIQNMENQQVFKGQMITSQKQYPQLPHQQTQQQQYQQIQQKKSQIMAQQLLGKYPKAEISQQPTQGKIVQEQTALLNFANNLAKQQHQSLSQQQQQLQSQQQFQQQLQHPQFERPKSPHIKQEEPLQLYQKTYIEIQKDDKKKENPQPEPQQHQQQNYQQKPQNLCQQAYKQINQNQTNAMEQGKDIKQNSTEEGNNLSFTQEESEELDYIKFSVYKSKIATTIDPVSQVKATNILNQVNQTNQLPKQIQETIKIQEEKQVIKQDYIQQQYQNDQDYFMFSTFNNQQTSGQSRVEQTPEVYQQPKVEQQLQQPRVDLQPQSNKTENVMEKPKPLQNPLLKAQQSTANTTTTSTTNSAEDEASSNQGLSLCQLVFQRMQSNNMQQESELLQLNKQQSQEQNVEVSLKYLDTIMKKLDVFGETVSVIEEILRAENNFWIISCFFLMKRYYQFRGKLEDALQKKINIFGIEDWDILIGSQQFRNFLTEFGETNNQIYLNLMNLLRATNKRVHTIPPKQVDFIIKHISLDFHEDFEQTFFVYIRQHYVAMKKKKDQQKNDDQKLLLQKHIAQALECLIISEQDMLDLASVQFYASQRQQIQLSGNLQQVMQYVQQLESEVEIYKQIYNSRGYNFQ